MSAVAPSVIEPRLLMAKCSFGVVPAGRRWQPERLPWTAESWKALLSFLSTGGRAIGVGIVLYSCGPVVGTATIAGLLAVHSFLMRMAQRRAQSDPTTSSSPQTSFVP